MANQLKMAIVDSILMLHAQRWSFRRIARELGIHRETVARHVRAAQADPKPAQAPLGSGSSETLEEGAAPGALPLYPEPAKAPLAMPASRSCCEPWREAILGKLAAGLSSQRILQDLREQGFSGSYYSVRRFVGRLGQGKHLPFRRMECLPGEEAQVDFGCGAPLLLPDGKRRRPHVFRLVLSHSRKAYSEVSYRQTTEDFIRCLENSFWQLGGVPKTLVIDNLRAAVAQPDWYDPELVPKLRAFCEHYGVVILPTKPYTPRHKGKVERGIGYVKDNALKGRTFSSLEEQNRHLQSWEEQIADKRLHGTTRQQVGQVFADAERPALRPLPAERFAFFHEAQRSVSRDGHVAVAKAYYSVPTEYLGRSVWVRWDSRLVRIFNQRFELLATHVRNEPGRFSTDPRHVPGEKISGVERGADWLLNRVRLIGPHSAGWAEFMLQRRGIEGLRVLQGLLALTHRHSARDLERACQSAVAHGADRLRVIRQLLKRRDPPQEQTSFLEEHPLIRPLTDYGQFVAAALRGRAVTAPQAAAAPQGFLRHDRTAECGEEKQESPGGKNHQGSRDIHPPWPGYPSSGCSPAEPDSVSPDIVTVVHVSSPVSETSHA
jgi:transposase